VPYVIAATWIAKPGEEDAVAAAVERLVEPSRAEPGNLQYHPHRDPENPRRFFIYEQYQDEDAFQAHLNSEHFRIHGLEDAVPRLETRSRERLDAVAP
jgi:(4S)-4-hydroxy-5-phosphonooxypentane-2,3-dione isomerase